MTGTDRFNRILLWSIVAVNATTICLPLVTGIRYNPSRLAPLPESSIPLASRAPLGNRVTQIPNSLRIPSLHLESTIQEGETLAAASSGVWRRPASSTPLEMGNMVLAGHRTSPSSAVFRYLPSVKVGDDIEVIWDGLRYVYRVAETLTVPENATWIEDQTGTNRLTLYTCTPLLASTHRFVVVAHPVL